MTTSLYTNGEYSKNNPDWHRSDSPFKARQVLKMIERSKLFPGTICEIGCGAGGILRALHDKMPETCRFEGYDVSPQALALAGPQTARLQLVYADITNISVAQYDLVLVMDVIEHIEDYFTFLRKVRPVGVLKMFHVPLDVTAQGAVRNSLSRGWDDVGHIHGFTKDTALKALQHCGYEVIDSFYTSRSEMPNQTWALRAANIPRRVAFAIQPDLAVRVLGGYSVLILAK